MQSDRPQPLKESPFRPGVRLTPGQVYFATIGLFATLDEKDENHSFTCQHIIHNNDSYGFRELGRLYKHDDKDEYYLIHYPGKDSDDTTTDQTTRPLSDIREVVRIDISKNFTDIDYDKIFQFYIVCEVNTYLLVKVDHFIFATYQNRYLKTFDSIKRDYNLDYLTNLFTPDDHSPTKTGWQNMLLDTWQCGHYVLQFFHHALMQTQMPDSLKIADNIVVYHATLYTKGREMIEATNPIPHSDHNIGAIDAYSSEDLANNSEEIQQTLARASSLDDLTKFFLMEVPILDTRDIDSQKFSTMHDAINYFKSWHETTDDKLLIIYMADYTITITSNLFLQNNGPRAEYESIIRDYAKLRILKLDLFNQVVNDPAMSEPNQYVTDYIKSHHGRFRFGSTSAYDIYSLFGKGKEKEARQKHAKEQTSLEERVKILCRHEQKGKSAPNSNSLK